MKAEKDLTLISTVLESNDLNIIYWTDPSMEVVHKILETLKVCEALKYVGVYPVAIEKHHLMPPVHKLNPLLIDIIPEQTYLKFASHTLDFDKDICQNKALLIVENDADYMRIDQYQTLHQVL
jgi:hypothetical protein